MKGLLTIVAATLLLPLSLLAQPSSTGPLAPPANGPRHADSTYVAIVDCTIHPTPCASTDHATVVFRDGRILQVAVPEGKGPSAPAAPAGAKVIEGKGLHVYPGFIDAYVDVDAPAPEGDPAALHWNRKVTPQRSALDGAGVDAGTADSLRRLGFATACIAPRGGVFRGASAVVSLAKPPDEQSAAKPPVYREKAYQSVAFELGGGYPTSEMGAMALIRQTFIDADWQKVAREAGQVIAPNCLDSLEVDGPRRSSQIEQNLDWRAYADMGALGPSYGTQYLPRDLASASSKQTTSWGMHYRWDFDHMPWLDCSGWALDARIWIKEGDCEPGAMKVAEAPRVDPCMFAPDFKPFVLVNIDDELEALRASKVLKEFGRPGVLLGCGTEFARLDAIKATELSFILPLSFPRTPDVSTVAKAETTELKDLMTWEQAPTNPRRLAKAGISFALTTAKLNNRADFAGNLKTALKYGLTEDQAIAALTTIPAEMLGVSDQVGTIEPGKRANLIVADGPIFGDKTKIRTVFIDGQPHEITTAPVDLEGRWDLTVDGKPSEDHWLAIDKDNGVTVHLKDKSSKASKVQVDPSKISFIFEHEPLDGNTGVYVISAVIEKDAAGKPIKLTGQGLKATGEGFAWSGARQPPTLAGSWPLKSETTPWEGGVLVFDEKNTLTFGGMPDLKPDEFSYEKGLVKVKVGDDSLEATVDFEATPPQMKGTVNGNTPFIAKRQDRAPRTRLAGSWTPAAGGGGDTWTELVFDSDTRGVLVVGDKQAKLEDIKVESSRVSFTVDRAAFGEEGVHKYEVKIDRPLVAAPTMSGTETDADGKETKFAMQRQFGATAVGKWRITETDGKPVDPAQARDVTLEVTTRGITVTVTRAEGPIVVKSDDVHLKGNKATFTHDLEKLGGTGKSTDEVTIDSETNKAVLTGVGTYPDGSKHAYKAAKVTDEPVQVAAGLTMTQDEAERIKQVPEKLPLPFGPYGFFEQPKPGFVWFKNATIWTCAKDGIMQNANLLIMDGKIAGIWQGIEIPSITSGIDMKPLVIDCTGKSITPGILDCHSHTGISRGVNEGGQAVTSECRIADVTDPDDVNWYRQLAGGVTTVNSLHGSANAIGGQSQTNKLRWGAASPEDMHFEGAKPGVKFALGENPRQVNFGGGGRRSQGNDAPAVRYPATRMGVETLIRDRFTAAREYDRAWQAWKGTGHADASPGMFGPSDDDLKDRIAATRAAIKDNEEEATRIEAQIKNVEAQIDKLKDSKEPKTNQIESLTKSKETYESLRSNISLNHNQLTARLAQLEKASPATPPASADSEERLESIRAALAQTNETLAEVDRSIRDIDSNLAKLSGRSDAKAQVDSLTRSREEFVQQKAKLESVRDSLKSRGDELATSRGSAASSESSRVPPRRDLELEALAEVLHGERLVHCHSYRQDEILMLCQVARDFNFKIGTFQHALEGYKVADYIRDTTWGGASGFADWWAYKVEVQDAIPAAFPIMHDVGVNVSFNSDSNELARRLNVDAAKAIKYGGLSPEEALKFITINPARQLQVDKRVGSIEVGKDADLAIWSGDPLSSMSMCVATYVDGRCLFSVEQDLEHRKRISSERQRLIQKILGEGRPRQTDDQAEGDGPPRGRGFGGFGGGGPGGRRRGPRPPQDEVQP
jgi:imidazolonepropionase-like amidohydrolase